MSYIIEALDNIGFEVNGKSDTYYNKEGISVPRVTEILSKMIHNDSLMYWVNSLGFKGLKYKDVLNKAANYGTIAHKAIENFLKKKTKSLDNIAFLGFLSWYNILTIDKGLSIEVIYLEHKISCKWFGGTLDALISINGMIYLVDFKTSNHITYSYFLQLAAYRFMLKQTEGIDINGVIVLQLNKEEPGFNEYLLDFSIPEHLGFINDSETSFLSLVYAYYNISNIEKRFKTIFIRR